MKKGYAFLACLLLSFTIWLIQNLSQSNSGIVSVSVIAESNLEGRAAKSGDAVAMSARCLTSGFRLLRLNAGSKPVTVKFDPDDFVHKEGDYYSIPTSRLYRYVSDIFGPGVSIESFLSQEVIFRFAVENCVKVPVKAVSFLDYRDGYCALDDIGFTPDSVMVYGDPQRLSDIDAVYTAPISHKDIHKNVHGEIKLDLPSGVRVSETSADYSLLVTRYVEMQYSLGVNVRNIPGEKSISVFPSTVDVALRCVFPIISDPTGKISCYVDYADFRNSLSGRCVVKCDGLPDGVIDVTVNPQVCECVENQR